MVDRIFNRYIRRQGYKEPYFAQFCNGTTVTCPGLSQWGTVPLAQQGMAPIEILRYYYPDDIQIVTGNNYASIYESYPGGAMRQGMTSENIRTMQDYLNRIRTNFPKIPQIANPNGYFGSDTTAAVKTFQSVFSLTPDGVIGRATWNKISSIYTGIKKLAELTSEGERTDIGAAPPTSTVREGATGNDVVELQFILDYLEAYLPALPPVIQSGRFDTQTRQAVTEFQKLNNLSPDGIVGPATWRALYDAYRDIHGSGQVPPGGDSSYPGYPLQVGSRGDAVRTMQRYLNHIHTRYSAIPQISADGIFGNATAQAVRAFQNLFGLSADGIIGPATWRKITEVYNGGGGTPSGPAYPGYLLKVGAKGEPVRTIQSYLNVIRRSHPSIPQISADGAYGNATANAVRAYQRLFNLSADGIVGKATWDSIMRTYSQVTRSTQAMSRNMARAMLSAMFFKR